MDQRLRGLSPSATLAISERSAALKASGREVYRLGLGQSPFPVPECVREKLRSSAHEKDYLPVRGLERLRAAVAAYHARRHGIMRTGDDVLIGPGSKELMFILQMTVEGELLLPQPSWVSYEPQARLAGRRVHWIPTDREDGRRIDPVALRHCCEGLPRGPRILLLNYPNNPVGTTLGADRLKELAAVARHFGLLVLSDEIYGELNHRAGHVSIARYYPEGAIVSAGLSKWCGAGGWRLGTFSFPERLRSLLDAMTVVASETFTAVSAPVQFAATRAFDGGVEIDDYLDRSRAILQALGRAISARMRASGIAVDEPEGGFYLMPDFSAREKRLKLAGIRSGSDLCESVLQETGVAMLPGSCFGYPESDLSARIAYVDFDGAPALAAARKENGGALGAAFLDTHCGRVLKAVELLCDWFERF